MGKFGKISSSSGFILQPPTDLELIDLDLAWSWDKIHNKIQDGALPRRRGHGGHRPARAHVWAGSYHA